MIDGDTFEIVDPWGIRNRVRLRRVNAPELNEPGGKAAKAALEARILHRRILIKPFTRGHYGRVIAEIISVGPRAARP